MSTTAETIPTRGGLWKPVLAGVLAAAPFVAGVAYFRDGTLDLLAFLLALTGGIYVGAALSGGRRGAVVTESLAAFVCFACAVLSMYWASVWLVWGYLFHAAWDAFRHSRNHPHGGVSVRRGFPPFCAVFDVVVALAVLFLR